MSRKREGRKEYSAEGIEGREGKFEEKSGIGVKGDRSRGKGGRNKKGGSK